MIDKATYFLLDRVSGTDEARVRCRVKWDGGRCSAAVSIGYRVNVARWDFEAQCCLPRSFHGKRRTPAAVINNEIERCQKIVDKIFNEAESVPSPGEVRARLKRELAPRRQEDAEAWRSDVLQAFTRFMAERGDRNRWTDATYTKMSNVRRHLVEWKKEPKWSDFDEDGLFSYVAFLRTSTRMDNRMDRAGLRDSTVEKHVSFLKWFLTWADSKGLPVGRDYITFKPKLQKIERPVIFLEWDELMTLYRLDLSDRPDLAAVRDVFCFCAFTSLRYSDARALTWADVDERCIRVVTIKTNDPLVIELNDYSQEILGRYVDEAFPGDVVFPVPANQIMNLRLKELGKLCGFSTLIRVSEFRNGERVDRLAPKWSLIGTHAARRTFICNALMMGIPPTVVMRWTGHSDYDAMKPYIAITDKAKASEMSKFNEKKRDK